MLSTRTQKLVMVIEDNEATREAFGLILHTMGYRVATASNGQEALTQLQESAERPSVIVLDLMMPVMDGWQFRARQRQDTRVANIPVIVCSAAGDVQNRGASLEAQAYLAKPVEPGELLAAIRFWCD
jgi:CheY-like chemotaxis protein